MFGDRDADGLQFAIPWTYVGSSSRHEASAAVCSSLSRRTSPRTSAAAVPATPAIVAHSGPPSSSV